MIVLATRKDLMIVHMGPQHLSMHGVFRLIFTLDWGVPPQKEGNSLARYLVRNGEIHKKKDSTGSGREAI